MTGTALLFDIYGDSLARYNQRVVCGGKQFDSTRLLAFAKQQVVVEKCRKLTSSGLITKLLHSHLNVLSLSLSLLTVDGLLTGKQSGGKILHGWVRSQPSNTGSSQRSLGPRAGPQRCGELPDELRQLVHQEFAESERAHWGHPRRTRPVRPVHRQAVDFVDDRALHVHQLHGRWPLGQARFPSSLRPISFVMGRLYSRHTYGSSIL